MVLSSASRDHPNSMEECKSVQLAISLAAWLQGFMWRDGSPTKKMHITT